jgi:hypothetical protein
MDATRAGDLTLNRGARRSVVGRRAPGGVWCFGNLVGWVSGGGLRHAYCIMLGKCSSTDTYGQPGYRESREVRFRKGPTFDTALPGYLDPFSHGRKWVGSGRTTLTPARVLLTLNRGERSYSKLPPPGSPLGASPAVRRLHGRGPLWGAGERRARPLVSVCIFVRGLPFGGVS